jgi:hypothetical protein
VRFGIVMAQPEDRDNPYRLEIVTQRGKSVGSFGIPSESFIAGFFRGGWVDLMMIGSGQYQLVSTNDKPRQAGDLSFQLQNSIRPGVSQFILNPQSSAIPQVVNNVVGAGGQQTGTPFAVPTMELPLPTSATTVTESGGGSH